MSDIEGIPQEKLDRLWMHLEKVERLTGGKLRETPRRFPMECPLWNFAPKYDREHRQIAKMGSTMSLIYEDHCYRTHTHKDTEWWADLLSETRIQITKWVMKKIKERNKAVE